MQKKNDIDGPKLGGDALKASKLGTSFPHSPTRFPRACSRLSPNLFEPHLPESVPRLQLLFVSSAPLNKPASTHGRRAASPSQSGHRLSPSTVPVRAPSHTGIGHRGPGSTGSAPSPSRPVPSRPLDRSRPLPRLGRTRSDSGEPCLTLPRGTFDLQRIASRSASPVIGGVRWLTTTE